MKKKYSLHHALFVVLTFLCCVMSAQVLGEVVYYHTDISGSPLAATDENGNLLWKESYRPYGGRMKRQDGGTNSIWFAGKPQDDGTGLSYFGARYYDPVIGRFMGIDPQGFDEKNIHSFNRYAYANNNPYKYIDPDGRSPVDIGFFAYDVFRLGQAIYLGQGVGAATLDVGLSALGVMSPIPGIGQVVKGWRAAERAGEAVKFVEHAGEIANKAVSKIEDVTKPGSRLSNYKTDVPKSEFEKNLIENGFSKSTSKDGNVNIFTKGDTKYTTREFSKSTDGPTAEVFQNNRPISKIRLGDQ